MFGCVKTLLLFYQTNFRVNINAEFLADRSPHGIRKSDNIRSRGTTRVHQHQRLPAVHRSRPQRLAFPATPVYHPGSRYLYPTGIHIIVRSEERRVGKGMSGYSRCKDSNCRRGTMGFIKKLPALPSTFGSGNLL